MKSKLYSQTTLCLLVLILICPTSILARGDESDIYNTVPSSARSRLRERLELLLNYHRSEQWESLFDLQYEPDVKANEPDVRKDEYVQKMRRYTEDFDNVILNFNPTLTTLMCQAEDFASYRIKGCAEQREKGGRIVYLEAYIDAFLIKEEWYFNPVGIDMPIGGGPKACSPTRKTL